MHEKAAIQGLQKQLLSNLIVSAIFCVVQPSDIYYNNKITGYMSKR